MEALFFVVIGAALFSNSWYVLGLYPEGRTMGVFVGALGAAALLALFMDPMLLTGVGESTVSPADHLAQITIMKTLIVLWAAFAIGIAAHGIWDFDERAVGLFAGFLTVMSLVAFLYYAIELEPLYRDGTWLGLTAGALVLTILGGMVFFALSFSFTVLRAVAGWFLLLGGGVLGLIGIAILTRMVI